MGTPDLVRSEALQSLVDEGALSEGSPEYMAAQKIVRSGWASLSEQERELYRTGVAPLLRD